MTNTPAPFPNFQSKVTKTAVKSGSIQDASVWGGSAILQDGDFALIPPGITVVNNLTSSPNLAGLMYQGGLDCGSASGNKVLNVATLLNAGGQFTCGSCVNNVPLNGTFTLNFLDQAPDPSFDPAQFGTGFLTMGGMVDMCGSANKTAWVWAQAASKGSRTLTLNSVPNEWNVGDTLLIPTTASVVEVPGTGAWVAPNQDELVIIAALSGNVVTLTAPLQYDHLPLPGPQGQVNYLPIANLTRNIVFQSQNPSGTRGHCMFMRDMMGMPSIVNACHALIKDCGRTLATRPVTDPMVDDNGVLISGTADNPRARYAWHSHRQGQKGPDGTTASCLQTWDSLVGWGGLKWIFDNHDSNVNRTNCVAYNCQGSGFATERGSEIGDDNNNFQCRATGPGTNEGIESRISIDDYGFLGSGFWYQGPGVKVTNFVACCNADSDIILDPRGLTSAAKVTTDVFDPSLLPDPSWANGVPTVPSENHWLMLSFVNFFGVSGVCFGSPRGMLVWNSNPINRFSTLNVTTWGEPKGITLEYSLNCVVDAVLSGPNWVKDSIGIEINTGYVLQYQTTPTSQVAGFEKGALVPIGFNAFNPTVIAGGYWNNVQNFVWEGIGGNLPTSATQFTPTSVPVFGTVPAAALEGRQPCNYYLTPNINFSQAYATLGQTLQGLLNADYPNPIVLPFCTLADGRNLFYPEQATDYVPLPSSSTWASSLTGAGALLDKTNAELWAAFGVAAGRSLSTVDGSGKYTDPNTNGLVGPAQTMVPPWRMFPVPQPATKPITLTFDLASPTGTSQTWDDPNNPLTVQPGWNVLTRTIAGHLYTGFVQGSGVPPPPPPAVSTTITATAGATLSSKPLTFAVTAANGAAVNEGSVSYAITHGGAAVAAGLVPVSGGKASVTVPLPAGSYSYTFSYDDSTGTFMPSSGSGMFTI